MFLRTFFLSFIALFIFSAMPSYSATYQPIVPTTTLAIETGNNTAAANSFPGCEVSSVTNGQCVDNGDLKASNVSKINIHSLLGPTQQGAKVYTTYIPYWGNNSHPNIGYSSQDPNQVAKEITDLTSRGFDGVIVDWYGQGSWEDGATQILKPVIEQSPLKFALMIDQGAIKWHSCYPSCSATQALLDTITYARSLGYFSSPAAMKDGSGKTIVTQFGMEFYSVDWPTILSANSDLHWIFENAGAFTDPYTIGAYGWLSPKNPMQNGYEGLDYTQYFESIASQNSSKLNWASTWKGFNDVVASWAPVGGRHIQQLCGKTWLDSWAAVRSYTGRLDAVQVVTWHDYEEGTELQSGIDNCQSVAASLAGTMLSYSVNDSSTLDHYTAYISTDGQNLMALGDFPVGTNALDISTFNFPPGAYQLYVKATGKPSVVNQMSAPVGYTIKALRPVVTITSPGNNTVVGSSVEVEATAFSNNGAIMQYWVAVDGHVIARLPGGSSLTYTTSLAMGLHRIKVLARDSAGKTGWAIVAVVRDH